MIGGRKGREGIKIIISHFHRPGCGRTAPVIRQIEIKDIREALLEEGLERFLGDALACRLFLDWSSALRNGPGICAFISGFL